MRVSSLRSWHFLHMTSEESRYGAGSSMRSAGGRGSHGPAPAPQKTQKMAEQPSGSGRGGCTPRGR